MSERNQEQAEDFRIAIKQRDAALADAAALREQLRVAQEQVAAERKAVDTLCDSLETSALALSSSARDLAATRTRLAATRERVTRAEALLEWMVPHIAPWKTLDGRTVCLACWSDVDKPGAACKSCRTRAFLAHPTPVSTEPDGASEAKGQP